MQRGKENTDTDAEVEMGSFHDSKDDDEEREYELENENTFSNYMRVASKESINDRYVATTTNITPSESENDTTDYTFRTDDTASDDFFISRTPRHKTTNTVLATGGSKRDTKQEKEEQRSTDSASDDFFISVNKTKSPTSIIQGNGIISSSPILLKSPSGIIREPNAAAKSSRKSRKERRGRSAKRTHAEQSPTKSEKRVVKSKSPPPISDGTATDEDLEEDFEDFEDIEIFEDFAELPELPEFSDTHDHSLATPRPSLPSSSSQRDQLAARAHANAFLDATNTSSTPRTDTSSVAPPTPRSPRPPTRVLSMGPSPVSLLSSQINSNSPPQYSSHYPSTEDIAIQRLPSSPSVKMPKVASSVTFQFSGSPGPPRSAFVDSGIRFYAFTLSSSS